MFIKQLGAQAVAPGEKLHLEVEIDGIPDPSAKWYKDDKLITPQTHSINSDGKRHYLTIPKGRAKS